MIEKNYRATLFGTYWIQIRTPPYCVHNRNTPYDVEKKRVNNLPAFAEGCGEVPQN